MASHRQLGLIPSLQQSPGTAGSPGPEFCAVPARENGDDHDSDDHEVSTLCRMPS